MMESLLNIPEITLLEEGTVSFYPRKQQRCVLTGFAHRQAQHPFFRWLLLGSGTELLCTHDSDPHLQLA